MIISRSPCRISLFGGGTDVNPFNAKHGGKVLNFAINLRHTGKLIPRDDKWIWIEAMGESRIWRIDKTIEYGIDPKFDLMRAIVNSYDLATGFYYRDEFEGIQGAGLGSSAAAAVAMIGAMNRWQGIRIEPDEVAKKAWKMEAYELGWYSGWQDQFASAYGGLNLFEWKHGDIDMTELARPMIESLLPSCVLLFTGKTRKSSEVQKVFYDDMRDKVNKGEPLEALDKLKELVDSGHEALAGYDHKQLGKLLEESWEWKKKSSPLATNPKLDEIYNFAKEKGAIGGKILGAGSDGHILFILPPEEKLNFVIAMEKEGLKMIDFGVDWQGLEVRRI